MTERFDWDGFKALETHGYDARWHNADGHDWELRHALLDLHERVKALELCEVQRRPQLMSVDMETGKVEFPDPITTGCPNCKHIFGITPHEARGGIPVECPKCKTMMHCCGNGTGRTT